MTEKGFSLIETVLYIGLFSILIPSLLYFTLGFIQKSEVIDPRIRMEEKAAFTFSELQQELGQAQSVDVTHSSFATSDSSLVYQDATGSTVTIRRANDLVTFAGVDQTVSRLQRQSISGNEWITDADMTVSNWNVEVVRDSTGDLQGVNLHFGLSSLNDDGSPYRDNGLSVDTTVHLLPQTTEL